MPIFFAVTLFAGLIVLANVLAISRNASYHKLFDGLLLLINLFLMLAGILFLLIPVNQPSTLQLGPGVPLENLRAVGVTLLSMAAWGIATSLLAGRRLLARWLPLNPASPVHALALVLSGYLTGSTILTLTQGGLEDLAASAAPANVGDILLQFVLFVLFALFGVGLLIRRNGEALRKRLGLERPTREQMMMGLKWMILLVALQWFVGALSTIITPGQLELLDEISGSLLADIDTVGEWLILALTTGIGEELLFRGALQPILGLKFTAALFAIAHVQYGVTPITFTVLIIGIALGYIRRQTNTTVAMFVHAGYNFILGLLSLLAVYLEQFIA